MAAQSSRVYMTFIWTQRKSLQLLYSDVPKVAPVDFLTERAMDFVFLGLLVVLVAMTWGFLRLCARLEPRR
jgi:hypothetical protein